MQDVLSLYRLAEERRIDVDLRPLRRVPSLSLSMDWAGGAVRRGVRSGSGRRCGG